MGLADRYRALPRAGRWLLWGAVAIALYFPLVEAPLNIWNGLSGDADTFEAQLASFHDRSRDGLDDRLALGAAHHGQLDPPGERADAIDRLDRRIAEIFDARGVGKYNLSSRDTPMSRSSALGQDGRPLERLIKEINFEAAPATALAILADLEREEVIPHAPFVQFQRLEDQGTVRTRITVEAWAVAETGGGR